MIQERHCVTILRCVDWLTEKPTNTNLDMIQLIWSNQNIYITKPAMKFVSLQQFISRWIRPIVIRCFHFRVFEGAWANWKSMNAHYFNQLCIAYITGHSQQKINRTQWNWGNINMVFIILQNGREIITQHTTLFVHCLFVKRIKIRKDYSLHVILSISRSV